MVLLVTPNRPAPHPVVVMVSQPGRAAFLKQRAGDIDNLLRAGVAVCLADVRGTGDSRAGASGERTSSRTSLSQTEQLLGRTVLGNQLRDVRTVLGWLRASGRFHPDWLFVWGDSFVDPLPAAAGPVPLDLDQPRHADPGAATLALLAGLFEDDLPAVVARGGLTSYQSLLDLPVLVPHDAVVPGGVAAGDLTALAAALGDRVIAQNTVDGRNTLPPRHGPVTAEHGVTAVLDRVNRR